MKKARLTLILIEGKLAQTQNKSERETETTGREIDRQSDREGKEERR